MYLSATSLLLCLCSSISLHLPIYLVSYRHTGIPETELSVEERVGDSIADGGHGLLAANPWAVPSKRRVPVHNVCQLQANPATPEDF